ncbi:MAG: hypothetical protein QG658_261 [Patescibacteria group bacterium]|nr:hypothetical protein [Patescibacteria group bacterium]
MSIVMLDIWKDYEGTGRWRLVCSEELFVPGLLKETDFSTDELNRLEDALFPIGEQIVLALGLFHGVTTHLNADEPHAIEFSVPPDIDPALIELSYRQRIDSLSVSIVFQTGKTLVGNFRD